MLNVNSSSTHFPAAGIRIKQLIIVPIAQKYLYRNTCFLLNPYHNTLINQLAQQPTFQLPMRLQYSMEFLVIKRSRKTLISLQSKHSKFPGKTQGGKSYLRTKKKNQVCQTQVVKIWHTFQHGEDHSCQLLTKNIDVKRNFTFFCVLPDRSAANIYPEEYI